MIKFQKLSKEKPYLLFKKKYDEALNAKQKNIEAISISTFNKETNEVDSRFVNVKFIDNDKFIFFSNYESPKSIAFESHNQISGLFFWSSIDVQIRMKAKIEKTSFKYSQNYFKNRSAKKNALAISSMQSKTINSYEDVQKKYNNVLENENLLKCPRYWGGYSFIPYYFEFWQGHKSRINRRVVIKKINQNWIELTIQP